MDNQFIYVVISPRARGLSVGVNMNPDKGCNFDCAYCEVNRGLPPAVNHLDVDVMSTELTDTLALVRSGGLRERPFYRNTPGELLELRHVALSGDGEPTLCADFMEAVQAVMHVRARGQSPFFKIVLLTNASGLDLSAVQCGLKFFTSRDEIWAKLDAGTEARANRQRAVVDLQDIARIDVRLLLVVDRPAGDDDVPLRAIELSSGEVILEQLDLTWYRRLCARPGEHTDGARDQHQASRQPER